MSCSTLTTSYVIHTCIHYLLIKCFVILVCCMYEMYVHILSLYIVSLK